MSQAVKNDIATDSAGSDVMPIVSLTGIFRSVLLNDAPVLIMCSDARNATALVRVVTAAEGDVVVTAHAYEAMERIRQIDFAAAVIGWQLGAENVVAELDDHMVPYCMFGTPTPRLTVIPGRPLVVTDLEVVVPTLVNLLSVQ